MTQQPEFTPDPAGAAARIAQERAGNVGTTDEPAAPRGRTGRPPGPNSTPRTRKLARDRKRRQLSRQREAGRERTEDEPEDRAREADRAEGEAYQKDDARIAAFAQLGRAVWQIAGSRMGYRPLSDDEATMLGEAMDPVAHKYLGFLNQYAAEVNLACVILMLTQTTKITEPIEPPKPTEAEVVE